MIKYPVNTMDNFINKQMRKTKKEKEILDKFKTELDIDCLSFDKLKIITKTYIVYTNVDLDIKKIFDNLEITPYEVPIKKRGRKKKGEKKAEEVELSYCSIVMAIHNKQLKGVKINDKSEKVFKNSICIVMYVNKFISFKIYPNGVFHITGCKFDTDALDIIRYFWKFSVKHKCYSFRDEKDKKLIADFRSVLRNNLIEFKFKIDRFKFNDYMNDNTVEYTSSFEPANGYTGINLKKFTTFDPNKRCLERIIIDKKGNEISEKVIYNTFLDTLPKKVKSKIVKKNEDIKTSFLIFGTGNIIMSSRYHTLARKDYYEFLDVLFNFLYSNKK